MSDRIEDLASRVRAGDHRALARTISKIEDRTPGYRDLISELYPYTGDASVIGVTGSPGAGKSTLVDKLAAAYRDRGDTVGVIAIDPSSPFTGGAVLGDRIRMASTVGDMDVFVRSMSARGTLGGLSTATTDAVTAMDAFGKDRIIIETVGAGQNEIDVVRAAETVVVLVPPGSGDSVQTLKAGILEIADIFVVNKADRDGADRTVSELQEMLELGRNTGGRGGGGYHGVGVGSSVGTSASASTSTSTNRDSTTDADSTPNPAPTWHPPILETVATTGEGVSDLIESLVDHRTYLERSGSRSDRTAQRSAEELRTRLREDVNALLENELTARGGIESLAAAIAAGESDPYTVSDTVLEPVARCLAEMDEGLQPAPTGESESPDSDDESVSSDPDTKSEPLDPDGESETPDFDSASE